MIEEQELKEQEPRKQEDEVAEPRSLEQIETDFRESRILTTPVFGMVDTNAFKGKPKVDKIRLIIKNWATPENISSDLMSKTQVYNYRSNINRYLRGEHTRLSKRVLPLIDEYRDFLLQNQKQKDSIDIPVIRKRKPAQYTEEQLKKKYAKNLEKMKFILENWKTPKKALSIMSQASINDYRKRVYSYLKGNTKKVSSHYHKLIEQYKDTVLANLNSRVKDLKVEEIKPKRRGGSLNIEALRGILEHWEDKGNIWESLGISESSYWNYRSRIAKYFKTGDAPKSYTAIIEEYRDKLPKSLTGETIPQSTSQSIILSDVKKQNTISASVNYPYYRTEPTQNTYSFATNYSIPVKNIAKEPEKEIKINKEDFSVSFIEHLQKLGVKEFTIKF